ncbi:MAG: peptidoglycan-associated lipoprotein Pal [Hyphomicrobiales bacterium]|jgi:peptidoglycan-associated lipoprotein|nr:peptidoglycan-associated lipoprotein Pal [Hyphomicrobiales bacterium]MBV9907529.1 peptidoglycan-associated lipoprotein Pal [Hyphomicrobiales bacterium]
MFANMSRSSIALAAALGLGLALSACAHNNPDNLAAGYGAAGPGSVQEFNQTVGDRVFFTTDQTDLSSTAQATLDKQAAWLNQYNKYSFTIEGHADERGTREYNFALGSRRAQAVHDYLVAKGISPSRMRTISYGKERPVAVCDDISCWSQNRRAVTVLNGAAGS